MILLCLSAKFHNCFYDISYFLNQCLTLYFMFYSFHLYLFVTPFHFLLAIIGLFCLLLQFTNTNSVDYVDDRIIQGLELYADPRKYAVFALKLYFCFPKFPIFDAPSIHGNRTFSLSPCRMMILTPIGVKMMMFIMMFIQPSSSVCIK